MKKNTGIKWGLTGLMMLVMLMGVAMITTAASAQRAEDSHPAGRGRERTFTSPLPTGTPHVEKTETPEPRHTPEPTDRPKLHTPEPSHTPEPEHARPDDHAHGDDRGHDQQPPHDDDEHEDRGGRGKG